MSVYMIIESKVKDPDKYQRYIAQVPRIIAKHQGRYLARGSQITSIMGDWKPERMIILEFPSETNIEQWLSCDEYKSMAPLREAGAETKAVVIQGYVEQKT